MRIGNWWTHSQKMDRYWRMWLNYTNSEKPYSERFAASVEVAWLKKVDPGFSISFGNKGSDTPIDWHISFYWLAFFGAITFPGLGAFCEKIGRGHKRELSLKIHGGSLWWNLWYNDDMGYDPYHKCDKWRRPKLWPWSAGRKKYRSWMCLREGCIDLNPLDAIWGSRYYKYTVIDTKNKVLKMDQFEGDRYELKLELQEVRREREHGPEWVRNRKFDHWSVAWTALDPEGVPFRNHSWKGDGVIASAERIDNPRNWWVKCIVALRKSIEEDRIKHNYRPEPKTTPEEVVKQLSDEKKRLDESWKSSLSEQDKQDLATYFGHPLDAEIVTSLAVAPENKENN